MLGIDPSLTCTGWGVIEYNQEQHRVIFIDCGSFKTKPSENMEDRLFKINDKIRHLIIEYNPSVLSIESLFIHNKNKFAGMRLAMLRGAILSCVGVIKHLSYISYMPKTVRMEVANCGSADKDLVKASLKNYLDLPCDVKIKHDASDAIAVALCHIIRVFKGQGGDFYKD